MEEDEFVDDHERDQFIQIKGLLPANPICIKPTLSQEPRPVFKMELVKNQIISKDPKKFAIKHEESQQELFQQDNQTSSPIGRYISGLKCIYTKFNNQNYNKLYRKEYFSGLFVDRRELRSNKTQLINQKQFFNNVLGEDISCEEQLSTNLNEVKFDSNFQSGNLFAAYKRNQKQYDLILQNDINSKGNTQWFYFSVTNLQKDMEVTFNIINLTKCDSLFNYGMQPALFSKLANKKSGQGWYRAGKDISYYKNQIRRESSRRYFYTLSFKIKAQFQNDTLFIAHCFPYSYSALQQYLDVLVKNPYRKNFIQRSIIGKSIANQHIEAITIAQPLPSIKDPRKILVFMARQHPGQSQGSFVCEGVINFFVSKSKEAQFLRSKYIIKIIPMINPDGVIFGNYRTNLAGLDLNRKWNGADNYLIFPQITCIRSYIAQLHKQKKIRYIIDLHGHSKKLSSFFYGNPNQHNPQLVRLFPYIASKLNSNQISFEDCTFSIQQQKKKTARVYLSLTHQISCIYTYQTSFYGFVKDGKKVPFGIQEFRGLGNTLCQALYSVLQSEWLVDHKQVASTTMIKYMNELKSNVLLMEMGNRNSSGSDSQPQLFQLQEEDLSQIQSQVDETKRKKAEERQKLITRLMLERSEPTQSNISSNTIIPQPTSSNCLPSRSAARSSKDSARPYKKKMIVMSLSKVNSIVPDKYQMALQPISVSRKQSSFKPGRTTRIINSPNIVVQTEPLQEKDWMLMRRVQVEKGSITSYKNWRSKEAKYISVSTTARVRKNMVLKMELTPKPLLSVTNYNSQQFHKSKDQNCQTNLCCFSDAPDICQDKLRTITYFGHSETEKNPKVEPTPIIRALKIHSLRQDSNILFDDMIKKYLIDAEKFKTKISPSQNHIFFQKNRFGESLQKSLSIKKKQIAPSIKRSRKKSQ